MRNTYSSSVDWSDSLPDMQKSTEGFEKISIEKVGVRHNILPMNVKTKKGNSTLVVANVSSYVDLDSETSGINMSKLARTLNTTSANTIDFEDLDEFVNNLHNNHNSNNAWVKARFQYVVEGKSAVTDLVSFEPMDVIFESKIVDNELRKYVTVICNMYSSCPCSKEMSMLVNNLNESEKAEFEKLREVVSPTLMEKMEESFFGSHTQNSEMSITVELLQGSEKMWIEDIWQIAVLGSSCQTFSTIKRADEHWITTMGSCGFYFNEKKELIRVPELKNGSKFVEHISRDCAVELNKELDKRIKDYIIIINNKESIHPSQDACAVLSAGRNLK